MLTLLFIPNPRINPTLSLQSLPIKYMLRFLLLVLFNSGFGMILMSANPSYASTLSNLHIDSSDLVIDREKFTATFTGSVALCFDDIKLLGEEAVFYFEDEQIKDIKEIHIYKNIRAIEDDSTVLLADKAVFEMAKSELKLTGHVVIEKNDQIMKAHDMTYFGKISDVVLSK